MDAIEAKTRQSLQAVKDAGAVGLYASVKAMASSVATGMVLQNVAAPDAKGNVATKLTQFGAAYLASTEGTDPATITADKTVLAPDTEAAGGNEDGDDADKTITNLVSTLAGKDGKQYARVRISLPKNTNPGRTSAYPVDDLEAPDAEGNLDGIFLEPSEKVKDPTKAYPAIASAANKRWKDKTPPRTFTSRVMDGAIFKKPGVQGVGIFRTK